MKVCFVTSHLYPYLMEQYTKAGIGGAEYQQQQIIKALKAEKDIQLSAITLDEGQEQGVVVNGVTVWKTFRLGSGFRILRFFHPMLTGLFNALHKADADIYYVRAASYMLLPVYIFCKLKNKKMIYAGAHETDFDPGKEILKNFRDKFFYHLGLRGADIILTQTKKQKDLLRKNYNKEGIVLRNISGSFDGRLSNNESNKKNVLWVATIRDFKRPELVLEIAKQYPKYHFIMIGGPDAANPSRYEEIAKQALAISNVTFKGFVPPDQVDEYFSQADVFLNTSIHEGFPNTFLQAWSKGVPVVTFFDPDNIVRQQRLGAVVSDVEAVGHQLEKLSAMPQQERLRIQQYFSDNHSFCVAKKYKDIFTSLLKGKQ